MRLSNMWHTIRCHRNRLASIQCVNRIRSVLSRRAIVWPFWVRTNNATIGFWSSCAVLHYDLYFPKLVWPVHMARPSNNNPTKHPNFPIRSVGDFGRWWSFWRRPNVLRPVNMPHYPYSWPIVTLASSWKYSFSIEPIPLLSAQCRALASSGESSIRIVVRCWPVLVLHLSIGHATNLSVLWSMVWSHCAVPMGIQWCAIVSFAVCNSWRWATIESGSLYVAMRLNDCRCCSMAPISMQLFRRPNEDVCVVNYAVSSLSSIWLGYVDLMMSVFSLATNWSRCGDDRVDGSQLHSKNINWIVKIWEKCNLSENLEFATYSRLVMAKASNTRSECYPMGYRRQFDWVQSAFRLSIHATGSCALESRQALIDDDSASELPFPFAVLSAMWCEAYSVEWFWCVFLHGIIGWQTLCFVLFTLIDRRGLHHRKGAAFDPIVEINFIPIYYGAK